MDFRKSESAGSLNKFSKNNSLKNNNNNNSSVSSCQVSSQFWKLPASCLDKLLLTPQSVNSLIAKLPTVPDVAKVGDIPVELVKTCRTSSPANAGMFLKKLVLGFFWGGGELDGCNMRGGGSDCKTALEETEKMKAIRVAVEQNYPDDWNKIYKTVDTHLRYLFIRA